MNRRNNMGITRREFGVALVATVSSAASAAAQKTVAPADLPPVSWSCPMHPEVVEDKPGHCPICSMTNVAVRLDLVWTCRQHPNVIEAEAGKCRICRQDLIRVIKAMSWTCRQHPTVNALEPGRCPTCKRPLVVQYLDRPHGDHNPKHGGQFFMAPNNWHVEVTHPEAGVFRIYCYDEYSKPFMPPGFMARLEPFSASGKAAPQQALPFKALGARTPYLEARAPKLNLPADVVVMVRFKADQPEYRFDFQFFAYSKEPS